MTIFKDFKDFRIFRCVSHSQVGKFTESQIVWARSLEAAKTIAREWAFELVEYSAEEYSAEEYSAEVEPSTSEPSLQSPQA